MAKNLTTKEFIEKAMKVHGDKYDYSKSVYSGCLKRIEIICSIHDSFWQKPHDHLGSHGCTKCSLEIRTKKRKKKTEEFVKQAKDIHNNLYDYSRAKYTHGKEKIEIICHEHGSFFQRPNDHLQGCGCEMCGGSKQLTAQEFIEKAILVHGILYDYSKVVYKHNKEKVEITCLKHGSFFQKPNNHLCGDSCPKCSHRVSKPEIQWLNEQKISKKYRQFYLKINGKRFKVDGYDPISNTVYEFFGDYWHGNPKKYKPTDVNETNKKTFGDLYQKTMNRIELFKQHGYNMNYIWENDYKGINT